MILGQLTIDSNFFNFILNSKSGILGKILSILYFNSSLFWQILHFVWFCLVWFCLSTFILYPSILDWEISLRFIIDQKECLFLLIDSIYCKKQNNSFPISDFFLIFEPWIYWSIPRLLWIAFLSSLFQSLSSDNPSPNLISC